MNKDKELEELFLAQKPQFDDNAVFMARLTKRLDAVEYVKQHQEATIRNYKKAMVAATIVFLLSTPANVPLFTFNQQGKWLIWLAENSRLIVSTALALLMSFGTISVINNVQEIMKMRVRLSEE